MRKLAALFSLILLQSAPLQAQESIRFDTLFTRPVGPGMVHTYIEAPALPWTINVLEVDLTDPFLEVEAAIANHRLAGGYETTGSMARRHDREGHRVVGAINADFYTTAGRPISMHIQDGQVVQRQASGRPGVGFDVDDRIAITFPALSGSLSTGEASATISGVNAARGADQLVLYNQFFGNSTSTNSFGTEAAVQPVGRWLVNDTVRVVVQSMQQGVGNMPIPPGGAVLSGHGASAAFLNTEISEGDTLALYMNVSPSLPRLKEMVSGGPKLVTQGRSDVGPRGDGADRHPRTAIGYSADSTRMYMVTVDGRQATSIGITLPELAYFLTEIGVSEAINLDGGGSTTMLVHHEIMNSPSDGSQRTVSNSLLVASSAPEVGVLAGIQILPGQVRLYRGQAMRFRIQGTDENFYPVDLDQDRISFSASQGVGMFEPDGRFRASLDPDTGYVYVTYEGLTDSARVIVKTLGEMDIEPNTALTDTTHVLTFSVSGWDTDGLKQNVGPATFEWTTSDPAVGIMEEPGRFRGRGEGTTLVIASFGALADTAVVTVEIESGTQLVSSLETLDEWTLRGENINLGESELHIDEERRSEGDASLRVDYAFTYDSGAANWIYLDTVLPIAGVPDSLFLDVQSNGLRHRVYFDVEDVFGNPFQLFAASFADSENSFKVQPSAFSRAQPKSNAAPTLYYPVRLKRIAIRLASGQHGEMYTGTMYLDNLRVTYPAKLTSVEEDPSLPRPFRLEANYPNPFHERTTIGYTLDMPKKVTLEVYDVLGRSITTLVDAQQGPGAYEVTFEGRKLPAGVYFYRLEADDHVQSGRMLLVK